MSNSSDNAEMGGGAAYDATAPVPYWHQNMELATICVANSLTCASDISSLGLPNWDKSCLTRSRLCDGLYMHSWVGLSVLIDLVIIAIPFAIIKRAALKPFERMALMLVFGASLLGTITCLIGICGIWFNRNSQAFVDLTYTDTLFVMLNDIEILMYTLGASATVASKYIISKVAAFASYTSSVRSRSASKGQELPSWRRRTGTWAAIHETDLGNNPSHFPVTREVCVNHDPEWIGGVSPQNSDFKDRSIEEEGAAPSVSEAKGSIFQNVDTTKAIVP
ncbi:putative integral membrane [Phaeomoniella chlamydospora]|uniref:Putative integral membrane n=1 Tax=Phaeomoniella chlamydospora TaxID=158046 RepID=A0A0G2EWU5_PHACM|nr:putative integral membrane [Phaeomoniella chlamydospora]